MSYRQDNLKRSQKIKTLLLYSGLGAFFYFSSGVIFSLAFNILSFIAMPVWNMENNIKNAMAGVGSIFSSKEVLEAENQRLSAELEEIRLQIYSLGAIKKENDDLMVEMGRVINPPAKDIIAAVLSGPNIPPYENLIIDAGRSAGVSVGDRVIYQPNIIVGEVSQVFDQSSKVKLYSADNTQTDVLLPTSDSMHAVAIGAGGGNFSIDLPSSISIATSTELLIPGSEVYILGVIDDIKVDIITATQRLLIRYPINIKNMRFVHVITSPANEYLQ